MQRTIAEKSIGKNVRLHNLPEITGRLVAVIFDNYYQCDLVVIYLDRTIKTNNPRIPLLYLTASTELVDLIV